MERWPMATATSHGKQTASQNESGKPHSAQHLRQGGRVSMSRRTSKWIIAAVAAVLGASPVMAQGGSGTYSLASPQHEIPMPLAWGEKDEGFFFSAEAAVMRINNRMNNQVVAKRGFIDRDGSIVGNPDGGIINIFDTTPTYFTTLFRERGPAGAVYGSQDVALETGMLSAENFQPGSRVTIGYRLRSGTTFEFSYMGITKQRQSVTAGIVPGNGSTGADGANAFLFGDYYNFSPYFAGPTREIISNVYLQPIPPGTGANLQLATVPLDLQNLGGFAVAAYGITNGAEYWTMSELRSIHTMELNMRVPVSQFEGTRTYWTGGLRYISFTERFRMTVEDHGFPDALNTGIPFQTGVIDSETRPEWSLRYTAKQKDLFYGVQTGAGGEAYLMNGFAVSLDTKVGVLAQHSKTSTVLQRLDLINDIGNTHSTNLFNVAAMFQGGAYLWWYAHEGITFRVGYEYLGIYGARRLTDPIDYDLGRLTPNIRSGLLSLDGFVMGVSFVF